MAEVVPKFTPGQPRYSPETFGGRLRNIASQLNPFMLLKSDGDVDAAKALLRRHDAGASNASDAELWAAQELCAARVHPDTGENILLPLCYAAYAPMQPPIVLGMLWPGGGALNQAFWQCYNQSYNSAVFFANKNKSSPVSDADAALSFAGSVAASVALGVGCTKLGASMTHPVWGPRVAGWAGFAGCVGAGWASLLLMRRDELANGVNVVDGDGAVRGQSRVAAREGIGKCCAARVVWNIPPPGSRPSRFAGTRRRSARRCPSRRRWPWTRPSSRPASSSASTGARRCTCSARPSTRPRSSPSSKAWRRSARSPDALHP
ncbi:ion transmembrane transporter [Aureococcus anophagefferens]|nr:ion transmembrane transporter [Aureococcus anophagefferens]